MSMVRDVRAIRVEIARRALESVFEECDRHDVDETGGRMVGHYAVEGGTLVVRAGGVIAPGPNAKRTSTSLFQDGEYQTQVFRRLEERDPALEHLGNWHTHHVNGYPRLSAGDVATYRRIVNHELHNLDFFYALLVTGRQEGSTGLDRYAVRHYVLFRGDDDVHEVRGPDILVTDEARIWPEDRVAPESRSGGRTGRNRVSGTVAVRAQDQTVLGVMYPTVKPRMSAGSRTLIWKGPLTLVDGTEALVRVVEVPGTDELLYYPMVSPSSAEVGEMCASPFASAAEAVRAVERQLNKAIYESAVRSEGIRGWKS